MPPFSTHLARNYVIQTDTELMNQPLSFTLDTTLLGNEPSIDARVAALPEADQDAVRHTLCYLYLPNGPVSISREFKSTSEPHLNAVEHFLLQWLFKRTDGKLRRHYGPAALSVARRAKYQCEQCGFSDVRALNLEQKASNDPDTQRPEFECLCANCNTVAARSREMAQLAADREKLLQQQNETENAAQVDSSSVQ